MLVSLFLFVFDWMTNVLCSVGFGRIAKPLDGGAHRESTAIRADRNQLEGVQAAAATGKCSGL